MVACVISGNMYCHTNLCYHIGHVLSAMTSVFRDTCVIRGGMCYEMSHMLCEVTSVIRGDMWDAAPGEGRRGDADVCQARLCRRLPLLRRLRGPDSAVEMHGRREVDAGVHQVHAYVFIFLRSFY